MNYFLHEISIYLFYIYKILYIYLLNILSVIKPLSDNVYFLRQFGKI
jgi:hypothetical protein